MGKEGGIGLGTLMLLFLVFFVILPSNSNNQEVNKAESLEQGEYGIAYTAKPTCSGCHIEFSHESSVIAGTPITFKFKGLNQSLTYLILYGKQNSIRNIRVFTPSESQWFFAMVPEFEGNYEIWLGELLNTTMENDKPYYDVLTMDYYEYDVIQIQELIGTSWFIAVAFVILVFFLFLAAISALVKRGWTGGLRGSDDTFRYEEDNIQEEVVQKAKYPKGFCNNCYQDNQETDKFCMMCGFELE